MASVSRTIYPTGDGKPMAETDLHRDVMIDLIQGLEDHFAHDPMVYVSGDLLMFYEEGNGRRHLAPDVFVVVGVSNQKRDNYLIWEEGKGPDFVVEVTSKATRKEDEGKKRTLHRDVLRVPEYFRFDPTADYLTPPFQGHRLVDGEYVPIEPVDGRLPSLVTGLHLEASGTDLRLYDPEIGRWLPTRLESLVEAEARARSAETELGRLRREVEALRRGSGHGNGEAAK